MKIDRENKTVTISSGAYKKFDEHIRRFDQFLQQAEKAEQEKNLPGRLSLSLKRLKSLLETRGLQTILKNGSDLSKDNTVTLQFEEFHRIAAYMKGFERFVNFSGKAQQKGQLSGQFLQDWNQLKTFLESQELPEAAKPDVEDGEYCCLLYYEDAHSAVDCFTINAWYVFALASCVYQALLIGSNAQLTAGGCDCWPEEDSGNGDTGGGW